MFELSAIQTLVTPGMLMLDDGHGQTGKMVHVHLILRSQTGGGANRVVKCVHEAGGSPVVLPFVHYHDQHLCHDAIDTFNTTVAVGWYELVDTLNYKMLIHSLR